MTRAQGARPWVAQLSDVWTGHSPTFHSPLVERVPSKGKAARFRRADALIFSRQEVADL